MGEKTWYKNNKGYNISNLQMIRSLFTSLSLMRMMKTLEGNIIIFITSIIIERNCNKIICDCESETFKKYFSMKPI